MAASAEAPSQESAQLERVSRTWLVLFALAWFGFWLLVMLPGQFMVVKLATVIDPAEKVALGSFLISEMAAVILVSVPVIGWLCDRTRTRFGRRRTWALGGLLVATLPFAWVGHQTSWAQRLRVRGASLIVDAVGAEGGNDRSTEEAADDGEVQSHGRQENGCANDTRQNFAYLHDPSDGIAPRCAHGRWERMDWSRR